MHERTSNFRSRVRNGERVVGTFLKTPSSIVAEVLGRTGLDVVCLDTEHAPFGRVEVDQCVAALRALDRPTLVRVPSDARSDIQNALDCGATGVLVPHVINADQAEAITRAAHFGDGGRGYTGSSRAAEYSLKSLEDHLSDSSSQTTVIVQIEDIAALDNVSEIAAVQEVDALFVGRADLAVAMGKSPMDNEVIKAVKHICEQGRAAGKTVGMFTPSLDEVSSWRDVGVTLFLLGSDQAFIMEGANRLSAV